MFSIIFRTITRDVAILIKRRNATLCLPNNLDRIIIGDTISASINNRILSHHKSCTVYDYVPFTISLNYFCLYMISIGMGTIWLIKRTFQPSLIRMKRKHGYLARKATKDGIKVLNRRMAKGRTRLTVWSFFLSGLVRFWICSFRSWRISNMFMFKDEKLFFFLMASYNWW